MQQHGIPLVNTKKYFNTFQVLPFLLDFDINTVL